MYMHISLLQHTYIISLYKVHNTEMVIAPKVHTQSTVHTVHWLSPPTKSTTLMLYTKISAYKVHNIKVGECRRVIKLYTIHSRHTLQLPLPTKSINNTEVFLLSLPTKPTTLKLVNACRSRVYIQSTVHYNYTLILYLCLNTVTELYLGIYIYAVS